MASSDHIVQSTFIKNVHKKLRAESALVGFEQAWTEHCQDNTNLEHYSSAMKTLADHWSENYKDEQCNCRIQWIYGMCNSYFNNDDGVLYQRTREKTITTTNSLDLETVVVVVAFASELNSFKDTKLRLLDVGSCYNPLKVFDLFEVIAIDIAPNNNEVYNCDFLRVTIDNNITNIIDNSITSLTEASFHVVVFSLLLEYLPCPNQRLLCCEKAYSLLKSEGLLIIITPDSKHVGANAKLMKSWRFVLAKLGFTRIKYEKLKYLHCMAFRKAVNPAVAHRWAVINKDRVLHDKIYIPQDLNSSQSQ